MPPDIKTDVSDPNVPSNGKPAFFGSVARRQCNEIAKDGIRRSGVTREDRSMFTQRSGSVASYAAVAMAAAILSAVGTWSATQFVASSAAQTAAPATGQLLTQPLADL